MTTRRLHDLAIDLAIHHDAPTKTASIAATSLSARRPSDHAYCAADAARADLDKFVTDVLLRPSQPQKLYDAFELLRNKLAAEPSISG